MRCSVENASRASCEEEEEEDGTMTMLTPKTMQTVMYRSSTGKHFPGVAIEYAGGATAQAPGYEEEGGGGGEGGFETAK
ncbi:unnamed protein product [Lampetra planeri]